MGEIGDAYRGIRERVNGLVAGADLDTVAPATPGWTVGDLLAHLTGVTTDIVQGNLDGVGTDEWTARQVSERRGCTTKELLTEWNEHGAAVEAMADQLGPASGRLLSDAVTHEHDIRGALGTPGARESEAVMLSFLSVGASLGSELDRAGAGALCVERGDGASTFGTGAPAATLRTTRFEFVRALTGRRSRAQIAAYDWADGELDPDRLVLARFVARPTDLVE